MDISVLAEQRREAVLNLLKGMRIKKSDGEGFDKDDVYLCMQQLCDVYEKSIEDLTMGYDAEIAEMQDKYQKYDENNDLYISLIMEAKKSSNEIISQAKAEVDEILTNGKEQIAQQEEEIAQLRQSAEAEKAALAAEVDQAKADAESAKATLAAEIESERERSEGTREKYKRQIDAMDQEFEEIKTNILRTAGKIDGLKAQILDQDMPMDWKLQDEVAVDVPEPDIAVEEEIAPEAPAFSFEVPAVEPEVSAAEPEAPAVEPELPVFEPAASAASDDDLTFEDLVAKLQKEEFAAPAEEAPAEPAIPDFAAAPEAPAVPDFAAAPEAPAVPDFAAAPEAPAAPEIVVEEPAPVAVEIPAAEPVAEPVIPDLEPGLPAFEPAAPAAPAETALDDLEDLEKLAGEEFTIDLPEVEAPAAEAPAEEEISFEGLEELFKE